MTANRSLTPNDFARGATLIRRLMGSGLLISLFGNSVVGGVLPAGMALGALPVVWIPILRTIEGIEDLLSPLAARLLSGRDAGRTLVACEVFDVFACVVALLLMQGVHHHNFLIAAIYIAVVSPIPLFIDVAEELFAGDLAKSSPSSALAFNALMYSMIGLSSGLLATPLGSLLSSRALPVTLCINLVMSIAAVLLRSFAVRARASLLPTAAQDVEAGRESTSSHDRVSLALLLSSTGPGSPSISALLALSSGIVSGFLVQWAVVGHLERGGMVALMLVAVGIGATVGPYIAQRACRGGYGFAANVFLGIRVIFLIGVLALATGGHPTHIWSTLLVGVAILGISGSASGSAVIQATSRQVEYASDRLGQIVGWSHAFSAGGALIGAWLGLILAVQRSPVSGVVASIVAAIAAAVLLRRAARNSAGASIS